MGFNTTVCFSTSGVANITAWGGSYGAGGNPRISSPAGGSGGGAANYSDGATTPGQAISVGNNYGNPGGGNGGTGWTPGGGGGAGCAGSTATGNATNAAGGAGIQCFLPGIST